MLLSAAPTAAQPHHRPGCGQASDSAAFIQKVWDKSRWQRKAPKPAALEAWHQILRCQPAARKSWREAKRAFYRHRGAMLWLEKYKPFIYPSGKRWAAPYPVALCESTENYYVGPSGAYGLISEPDYLPPKVQDEIAYEYLHTVGAEQAWFRWEREQGCPYI